MCLCACTLCEGSHAQVTSRGGGGGRACKTYKLQACYKYQAFQGLAAAASRTSSARGSSWQKSAMTVGTRCHNQSCDFGQATGGRADVDSAAKLRMSSLQKAQHRGQSCEVEAAPSSCTHAPVFSSDCAYEEQACFRNMLVKRVSLPTNWEMKLRSCSQTAP